MTAPHRFVGRRDVLRDLLDAITDPYPKAILLIGAQGMGKTRIAHELIEKINDRRGWGGVYYEVASTDSMDTSLQIMLQDVNEVTGVARSSFDGSRRSVQQWRSLLGVLKIKDLAESLMSNQVMHMRTEFLRMLAIVAKQMEAEQRALIVVDPYQMLHPNHIEEWGIIVRNAPTQIKFLFLQRPDDVLAQSVKFRNPELVSVVPKHILGPLTEQDVTTLAAEALTDVIKPIEPVTKRLLKYDGHPYSVTAAIHMLATGTSLNSLPEDPTGVATMQWRRICEAGTDAQRLFEAFSVLDIPVPMRVAAEVASVDLRRSKEIFAVDPYLGTLLVPDDHNHKIYHSILRNVIVASISRDEQKLIDQRAIEVFAGMLEDEQYRFLAAERLPIHTLRALGMKAFVQCLFAGCMDLLIQCGKHGTAHTFLDKVDHGAVDSISAMCYSHGYRGALLTVAGDFERAEHLLSTSLCASEGTGIDVFIAWSHNQLGLLYDSWGKSANANVSFHQALRKYLELEMPEGVAATLGNLGMVYEKLGLLDEASEMLERSIQINEELQRFQGLASNYVNKGNLAKRMGNSTEAERCYRNALNYNEKLQRPEGIATNCNNLGNVLEERGIVDAAIEYYSRAVAANERLGRLVGLSANYLNLSRCFSKKQMLTEAIHYQQLGAELEIRLGRSSSSLQELVTLKELYLANEDAQAADEVERRIISLMTISTAPQS